VYFFVISLLSFRSENNLDHLGWIIDHTDTDKCVFNNVEGECVGVFLLIEVQKYYKLRDPKERLNIDFAVKLYE
jgi:hypothetical protein